MLCKNMDKKDIKLSREEKKLKKNMNKIDIWNFLKNKINFSMLININECWNLVKFILKNVTFVQCKKPIDKDETKISILTLYKY